MKYYILNTAKFANECIKFQVYGSTNSNWLANIEIDDVIFISQFNYKSQDIYGPFKICKTLFYDKKIIYPDQKFYYRIEIKPMNLKTIEETDLYLQSIRDKNLNFSCRLIGLIQQNKHLHSINLTENEGRFLLNTLTNYGKVVKVDANTNNPTPDSKPLEVNLEFLANKNHLFKKNFFSSESDLESYILLSLKDRGSTIFKNFSEIFNYYSNNNITTSVIYNQFIFNNAYPSDIVIINDANINILELKKDPISKASINVIKKEFKKYCYYSLFSSRLPINNTKRRMNFYLIFPKNQDANINKVLKNEFSLIINSINEFRKNNFGIIQYYINDNKLIFEALRDIKN